MPLPRSCGAEPRESLIGGGGVVVAVESVRGSSRPITRRREGAFSSPLRRVEVVSAVVGGLRWIRCVVQLTVVVVDDDDNTTKQQRSHTKTFSSASEPPRQKRRTCRDYSIASKSAPELASLSCDNHQQENQFSTLMRALACYGSIARGSVEGSSSPSSVKPLEYIQYQVQRVARVS